MNKICFHNFSDVTKILKHIYLNNVRACGIQMSMKRKNRKFKCQNRDIQYQYILWHFDNALIRAFSYNWVKTYQETNIYCQ